MGQVRHQWFKFFVFPPQISTKILAKKTPIDPGQKPQNFPMDNRSTAFPAVKKLKIFD